MTNDGTMTVKREGGCLCGAVRYSVTGEPLRSGICHCTDCRQAGGSAFSFYAIWPREAFTGEGTISSYKGRSFCPSCGSRLYSLTADEAEILVGSLDEAPSKLVPEYELWIFRREEWLHGLPWATQFEQNRPDPEQDKSS